MLCGSLRGGISGSAAGDVRPATCAPPATTRGEIWPAEVYCAELLAWAKVRSTVQSACPGPGQMQLYQAAGRQRVSCHDAIHMRSTGAASITTYIWECANGVGGGEWMGGQSARCKDSFKVRARQAVGRELNMQI